MPTYQDAPSNPTIYEDRYEVEQAAFAGDSELPRIEDCLNGLTDTKNVMIKKYVGRNGEEYINRSISLSENVWKKIVTGIFYYFPTDNEYMQKRKNQVKQRIDNREFNELRVRF